MKINKKCHCCGHEREVEVCDECYGSGVKIVQGDPHNIFYSGISAIQCEACEGTGFPGGKWITLNGGENVN